MHACMQMQAIRFQHCHAAPPCLQSPSACCPQTPMMAPSCWPPAGAWWQNCGRQWREPPRPASCLRNTSSTWRQRQPQTSARKPSPAWACRRLGATKTRRACCSQPEVRKLFTHRFHRFQLGNNWRTLCILSPCNALQHRHPPPRSPSVANVMLWRGTTCGGIQALNSSRHTHKDICCFQVP